MSDTARHAEIAGAGFAGLTAATALRQRGWTVRVHEKSSELREFGAGIMMWENGFRVLEAIGAYDDVFASSHAPPFYETRRHNSIISQETFGDVRYRCLARQDLYRAVLAAAEREGVEIVVDSEVVGAEPEGVLLLESGERLEADLVVGADGVRSTVRDSLGLAQDREKYTDGIIRLLVPRADDQLGPGQWDNVIDFWHFDPRVLRVLYVPCNPEELYVAFMAPRDDPEGAQVPLNKRVWVETFPHLEPVIESAAELQGRYDGYETTRVESWSRGNVVLVGDAAHAMCPALAQGAGCAMMNGLSMAVAVTEVEDLPPALQAWERDERPITDRCQDRSAFFADTRSMSKGNQFTDTMLETARYVAPGAGTRQAA